MSHKSLEVESNCEISANTKDIIHDLSNDNIDQIKTNTQVRQKAIFVGDISVGKTSIISRFTEDKFKDIYEVIFILFFLIF